MASTSSVPSQSVPTIWDCSICMEALCETPGNKSLGKCTHIFHEFCIDTWLKTNQNCPECRSPWKATLITNATDASELVRKLMNHHAEKKAKKQLELANLQNHLLAMEAELIKEKAEVLALPKKPLGERLDQLSEKQLRSLAEQIWQYGRCSCNLQTFIRDLFNEKAPSCKEANDLWAYFQKKKDNPDIMYEILTTYAERYFTSIEQLKNAACRDFKIWRSDFDKIMQEIKQVQ